MRGTDHHQSRRTLMGFGETASPLRSAAAEGYHQGNSGQAAPRRRLEPVFAGRVLETKRWHAAGSEERRLRHWTDRSRTATGGCPLGECSRETSARLAGRQSEQNGRI